MLFVPLVGYEQEIHMGRLYPRVHYRKHGALDLGRRSLIYMGSRDVGGGWNRRNLGRLSRRPTVVAKKE